MRRENASTSIGPADPDQDAEESFLERWSRRKQRARSESGETAPDERREEPAADAPEVRERVSERVLTDEDMPPLDSLDADSDFSGFLSPGVSEKLRNAALRKLFLSSKFNVVDGLDDYADDFTSFEPLGNIITADMRHQTELAEERARKARGEERAETAESTTASATEPSPVNDDETAEQDVGGSRLAASGDHQPDANEEAADGTADDPPNDDRQPG